MKILYFSTSRAAAGLGSEDIPLDGTLSGEQVWAALIARHPGLAPLRSAARLSRNEEYADDATRFLGGDVVAVIPPVSGG